MSSALPLFVGAVYLWSGVMSAPTSEEPYTTTTRIPTTYDASEFQEVHDQRQNGTENYRINVNGVVLMWTPPGALLTAASFLDPALFDDYPDLEEILNPAKPVKPQDLVVKPETTKPPGSTGTNGARRKIGGISGLIRSFVRMRSNPNHHQ